MAIHVEIHDAIRGLKHPHSQNRIRALKSLQGPYDQAGEAIPHLLSATDDPESSVREVAAHSLATYGVGALPALVKLLNHEDKYVRRNAVWGIARIGPPAGQVCPTLCALLRDQDPRTASAAAQALGAIQSPAAIPALIEAMRGTNVVLCRLASKALSQIGLPAMPSLSAHLKHHDPFVRGEAALAIGWIGPAAAESVPALIQLIQTGAKTKLSGQPKQSSQLHEPVTPVAKGDDENPDYEVMSRIYAVQALGRMGSNSPKVVSLLTQISQDRSDPARSAAETSLRQISR